MTLTVETDTTPLKAHADGSIRVSGTKVFLEIIVYAFNRGEQPAAIHDAYPGVPLSDIYATIGYYLRHREEVEAYIERRQAEARRIREEVEAKLGRGPTREELLKREFSECQTLANCSTKRRTTFRESSNPLGSGRFRQ